METAPALRKAPSDIAPALLHLSLTNTYAMRGGQSKRLSSPRGCEYFWQWRSGFISSSGMMLYVIVDPALCYRRQAALTRRQIANNIVALIWINDRQAMLIGFIQLRQGLPEGLSGFKAAGVIRKGRAWRHFFHHNHVHGLFLGLPPEVLPKDHNTPRQLPVKERSAAQTD